MKTAGIIAEYNPFHNGHRYLIDQIRSLAGADYVIIAMSGDFVQRGEPAVYDKYTRTAIALNAGADLVLELPAAFACSSAEDFAACGVSLLDRLGVVDLLCFGSECGKIEPLRQVAEILVKEPEDYQMRLKALLRQGEAYPLARRHALCQYEELLSSPNNILGIEYLKALARRRSPMQPFTLTRSGHGYHDTAVSGEGEPFASASALRQIIGSGTKEAGQWDTHSPLAKQMPSDAVQTLPGETPVFADDLSLLLNYRLMELDESGTELTDYADVSPELAGRLKNQVLQFAAFSKRIEALKTRQYTYTRISRALLHIVLGITTSMIEDAKSRDYGGYARVLGFRRSAAPLLGEIKRRSLLPLITKTADARQILTPADLELFQKDLYCAHLYQMLQSNKSGTLKSNESTHPIVII